MKTLLVAITLISLNVFAMTDTVQNVETVLNPPDKNEVFIPPGFDDMDDAEVTYVNRTYTACYIKTYSLPPTIDKVNKVIRISNFSMVLKADYCLYTNATSPTTVKLGELPAGTYKLEFETEKGRFESYSQIHIAKSKVEQKDDFNYAALDINELTAVVNKETKEITLTLPGEFPNGCFKIKEVKVIENRSVNVVEVLPIVEIYDGGCVQAFLPYKKVVVIPYTDTGMKKLIHIRSSNGVAINRVISL